MRPLGPDRRALLADLDEADPAKLEAIVSE